MGEKSGVRTLGIDLGGTHARVALLDEAGALLKTAKIVLADRRPEAVVEAIARGMEDALAGVPAGELVCCGVGAAAQLKGATGEVAVAPNLGWRDVPFGAMLSRRLRCDVRVVNDLSAAAWGELRAGAGRGVKDLLVVFVGSGVGSAIVSNGVLVSGAGGVAGELGHIKVVPDGRLCGCGERGCLEAYAGGHNLIAQMTEVLDRSPALKQLSGGDATKLNPVLLEQAALGGDAAALEIYQRASAFLALAIANQVTVLNPAKLILGGGVLLRCPGIRAAIAAGVDRFASRVSRASLSVADAALGDDSGLIGAGLLAREHVPA